MREPKAWQRMTSLYGPLVYAWCRRRRLQPDDAADLVQEVFQAVAGHIADFRHDAARGTFRGWLWTITRNKLNDHFRRQGAQPVAAGGSEAQQRLLQIPVEDSEEPSTAGDSARMVRQVLELIRVEFENRTWQAFWRAVIDGHRPADIAADLGISTNAVYVAKSRVCQRLREELADLDL